MSKAVIGAPEFRARSGRLVKAGLDGSLRFGLSRGYIAPDEVMDAEEFFQAQRDLERGWWRWPANPDWVAIEGERQPYGRTVVVVHERTLDRYWLNDRVLEPGGSTETEYQAARAYFEAHPKRGLPTENGVYVPATAALESGPLTFVLYNGSWRSTPGTEDAAESASEWHDRCGLVRLNRVEDAS